MYRRTLLFAIILVAAAAAPLWATGAVGQDSGIAEPAIVDSTIREPLLDAESSVRPSHRLIVELAGPPLADWAWGRTDDGLYLEGGRLDTSSAPASAYVRRLEAEQDAFLKSLRVAIPEARIATFLDEHLKPREARYTVVFNGVAVEAGLDSDVEALERRIAELPGVQAVHRDWPHDPDLYASIPLINAEATWNLPSVGGKANAGAGVKVASMDGGIHHAGSMFAGDGYEYPLGYPIGHLGNTNKKIIASRAYFRTWDPPTPGDENPWPGERGTSHGQHTASTMVGDPVEDVYDGVDIAIEGVAPHAYAMSYRVFYNSTQNIGSFYEVEGIACLDDIVRDGADVVNNSWGGGPASMGGGVEPLDAALLRAWRAGVFVTMSAGNSGPQRHTVDHPSQEYISVAATSTDGTFTVEGVNVTAPEPVSDTLKGMPMSEASFGGTLERGAVFGPYGFTPAAAISETNYMGCDPYPDGSFDGRIALISRGECNFDRKILNAQTAGAVAAIVHNDEARGDALVSMGDVDLGDQVTIPAVFVGYTNGMAMTDWYGAHGDASEASISTQALQIGNTPDILAGFSSRGPGVGNVLKPDIAAPGVNILAQGFADAVGEARHLGYGQGSGTSMAAPHVSGAAALLRQVHPDWPPAAIKSALMSTSKYTDIYLDAARTTPAQPLDIGAGRLDLTRAADPGVILDPPSLSFGKVVTGTVATLQLTVTNVADEAETYTLSTVDVSNGFTMTEAIAGLTFAPPSVALAPGESATITLEWDTAAAAHGYGDNQGYLLLAGTEHEAHAPAWMRVGYTTADADILLIDNDGSNIDPALLEQIFGQPMSFTDYTPYYTETLEALGQTYDVLDVDPMVGAGLLVPEANWLERYALIIVQTGDNPINDMSGTDQHRLREYSNHGGPILAFGQELAAVFGSDETNNPTVLYQGYFGAEWLSDSVNDEVVFTQTAQIIMGAADSPFSGYAFDVSARGDGAGNQLYIDEIRRAEESSRMRTPEDATRALLQYGSGGAPVEQSLVGLSNRDRPSLENPQVSWAGKNIYYSFGLEGVNSDTEYAPRDELMARSLQWLWDDPTAVISPTVRPANSVSTFSVQMENSLGGAPVSLRWDFGDGSPFTERYPVMPKGSTAYPDANAGHTYYRAGTYTVRVEAANSLGTRAIGSVEITVPEAVMGYIDHWIRIFLPSLSKRAEVH